MADFVNRNTKIIVLSVGDPEYYNNNEWLKVSRSTALSLQNISKNYIVIENDTAREMTQQEKDAFDATIPVTPGIKYKNDVMSELWMNIAPLSGDTQEILDEKNARKDRFATAMMTPYWQFLTLHLDNNDYNMARDRAQEILALGVITSGDYEIFDGILPTVP